MTETIGARIERVAKEKRGWTLAKFADELGVSYETVRKWVKGDTAPNRNRVTKVCELLSVTPDFVMFGTIGEAPKPRKTDQTPVFEITETDWGNLSALKDMSDDDAAFIAAEIKIRHERHVKLRAEMFAKAGLPVPAQPPGAHLPMSPRGTRTEKTVLVKVVKGPAAAPATKPRTRLIAAEKVAHRELTQREKGKR